MYSFHSILSTVIAPQPPSNLQQHVGDFTEIPKVRRQLMHDSSSIRIIRTQTRVFSLWKIIVRIEVYIFEYK